jgi:hypothetical protein
MSEQTALDDDLAFERLLLGAGHAESLPRGRTEAALVQFAAGLAALPGSAIATSALGGPTASVSASAWSRLLATAKWVALGAIVGGVATFAWLQRESVPHASSAPAAVPAPTIDERAKPAEDASSLPRQAPAAIPSPSLQTAPEAGHTLRAASASASPRPSPKPGSDLAAEVTALDGIRTALSIGAWQGAELKLVSYRSNFAHGALRSEAEVLALEVLVAQGRKQAAASAAERFILQHPRDPQVARVRALVE